MSTALSDPVAARHSRRPAEQAPPGGRARAGAGVVEREERGRPAEGGGDRVLEEPVGLRVGGDPGVGVDVDRAGQHEQPGRVDDLTGRRHLAAEVRLDGNDPPAVDRHVSLS